MKHRVQAVLVMLIMSGAIWVTGGSTAEASFIQVDYNTKVEFDSNGLDFMTVGSQTITFFKLTGAYLELDTDGSPSNGSFGAFQHTAGNNAKANFTGVTGKLIVEQTGPVLGMAVFEFEMNGKIRSANSSLSVDFTGPCSVLISMVSYEITEGDSGGLCTLAISPKSIQTRDNVNMEARLVDQVPEPASMTLLALGLIGGGFAARRRKK